VLKSAAVSEAAWLCRHDCSSDSRVDGLILMSKFEVGTGPSELRQRIGRLLCLSRGPGGEAASSKVVPKELLARLIVSGSRAFERRAQPAAKDRSGCAARLKHQEQDHQGHHQRGCNHRHAALAPLVAAVRL
jgi:hypothetical protein